jgi:hypothetical protein
MLQCPLRLHLAGRCPHCRAKRPSMCAENADASDLRAPGPSRRSFYLPTRTVSRALARDLPRSLFPSPVIPARRRASSPADVLRHASRSASCTSAAATCPARAHSAGARARASAATGMPAVRTGRPPPVCPHATRHGCGRTPPRLAPPSPHRPVLAVIPAARTRVRSCRRRRSKPHLEQRVISASLPNSTSTSPRSQQLRPVPLDDEGVGQVSATSRPRWCAARAAWRKGFARRVAVEQIAL